MSSTLERPPERPKIPEGFNMSQYINDLGSAVENEDIDRVEELLLMDHGLGASPGELEAFQWLQGRLGDDIPVQLDKTGMHVIPKPDQEE